MENTITAGLLGFSFGNLWLCVLLVLSLTSTNRSTCAGYLVGRAGAILALSVLISLVGSVVMFEKSWLNVGSGVMLLFFAGYLAATRLLGWTPSWKKNPAEQASCNGECSGCSAHDTPEAHEACQDCHDDKLCDAEEPEVRELTAAARGLRGRIDSKEGRSGFIFGVGLGSLRGASVCVKLIVLVPLLMQVGILEALAMATAFTITSSIYPVLGFIFGSWALKVLRFKRALVAGGAIGLALSGAFYLFKGVTKIL